MVASGVSSKVLLYVLYCCKVQAQSGCGACRCLAGGLSAPARPPYRPKVLRARCREDCKDHPCTRHRQGAEGLMLMLMLAVGFRGRCSWGSSSVSLSGHSTEGRTVIPIFKCCLRHCHPAANPHACTPSIIVKKLLKLKGQTETRACAEEAKLLLRRLLALRRTRLLLGELKGY